MATLAATDGGFAATRHVRTAGDDVAMVAQPRRRAMPLDVATQLNSVTHGAVQPHAGVSSVMSAAEAVARGWLSTAEYVDLMAALEEELMADLRADGESVLPPP